MGVTEIVQALVSPVEKLIDAVSGAIGKAYEPKHVRKLADAKAYELKLISETVRNNSDVPIVYDSTGVSIDTSKTWLDDSLFNSVEDISDEDMQKI